MQVMGQKLSSVIIKTLISCRFDHQKPLNNFSAPRDIPNNILKPMKVKNDKFINVHPLDSSALLG